MADKTRDFPVIIEQDETGAYCATCPVLPAAISAGKTSDEALANIREAIELALECGDKPVETITMAHVTVAA